MVTVYNKISSFKNTLDWIEKIYPDYGESFPFSFYAFRELKNADEESFREILQSKLSTVNQELSEENEDNPTPVIDAEYVKQSQEFSEHRKAVKAHLEPWLSKSPNGLHVKEASELIASGGTDYIPLDKLKPIEKYFDSVIKPSKKQLYWNDTIT